MTNQSKPSRLPYNREDFWDEEDSKMLGYASSQDVNSFSEVEDLEYHNEIFQNQKIEPFPDKPQIIHDRVKKYNMIISCLKDGLPMTEIQRMIGVSPITIKSYKEKFLKENPDYKFLCRCGRDIDHYGTCKERLKILGTTRILPHGKIKLSEPFTEDEIIKLVFWYKFENISISRLAHYFKRENRAISKELRKHGVKIKERLNRGINRFGYGMVPFYIYRTWEAMIGRCYRPTDKAYHRYGGRGIRVCERWLNSAINFYKDMGDKPKGNTIDRIDPDGNYEPSNCRWADNFIQQNNKSMTSSIRKLTNEEVSRYRRLYSMNILSMNDIARTTGLCSSSVRDFIIKKTYKNVA